MKRVLTVLIIGQLAVSCGKKSTETTETTEPVIRELVSKEGFFFYAENRDGEMVNLHLNDGSHFVANDASMIKVEGASSLDEIESNQKIEISYRPSAKEYTTQMAYVDGSKGKVDGFLGSEEGTESLEEIALVSYDAFFEGNEAVFTIQGIDKDGSLVEYQSSWSEMNQNGEYGDDFQFNTKSMEAILGSGLYDEVVTNDDNNGGRKQVTLLDKDSEMTKIIITTINYRLKEMEKIKVIQ